MREIVNLRLLGAVGLCLLALTMLGAFGKPGPMGPNAMPPHYGGTIGVVAYAWGAILVSAGLIIPPVYLFLWLKHRRTR